MEKTNILCDKENITLIKMGNHNYKLLLTTQNSHINLKNLINFRLYKILSDVNKQHMESCIMTQQVSDNVASFLFKFNSFGVDIGIPKKYMYLETTCVQSSNILLEYKSIDIEPDDKIHSIIKGYDKITCNFSNLLIELISNQHIKVEYNFDIDIHENLPIFAQNLLGFLMKKMFLNLKIFIENIL